MKQSFLQRLHPKNPGYQRYEGWCMRLGLAILLYFNLPVQTKFTEQPKPNGLAALGIDFTWAGNPEVMKILMWILLPALACYVFGVVRWLVLPYMATLSLAVGTLKNSQGEIAHVYQAMTMVLLVQAIWHIYYQVRIWIGKPHHFHPGWTSRAMEIFVTQSALVGIYLTTAVTKLHESGGMWLWQIRKVGVELERTWQQKYYHKLEEQGPEWALQVKNFITEHPWSAIVIFGPGLIAEIIVPIALYGRKRALVIGILLIILHIGAIYIMRLTFAQNIALLLLYFVNIPYWVVSASQAATRRARASS